MPACNEYVQSDRNDNEESALGENYSAIEKFVILLMLLDLRRAQEKELKKQLYLKTVTSILGGQAKLANRLNDLQLQADRLDDDGQLSKSSSRMGDNIGLDLCRGNKFRRLNPVSIDDNEENQLRRETEQQQTSTANINKPPAIPPRQGRPTLFLQKSTAPKNHSKFVLNHRQQQSEIQNTGNSRKRSTSCCN